MRVIKNRVVIGTVLSVVLFFVIRHAVVISMSTVTSFSSCILYPFLRIQHVIINPIYAWSQRRESIRELEYMIADLQKERDLLLTEKIAHLSYEQYMHDTYDLRLFNERYLLSKGRIAQVLARHFSSSSHFFLVDAGMSHGVTVDMVALAGNSIVGKVVEVYPWYCKVCLITDIDCKVACRCLKNKTHGIHEGTHDLFFTTVRYVSHLESIEINDMVVSSGEGLIFPRGFALGTITAINKSDLFYTIVIKPMIDFQTLHYCTLIAKEEVA